MNKRILYRKAYRELQNAKPLSIDCGLICGKRCCMGDDSKGMHLYPGEEIMHLNGTTFLKIKNRSFNKLKIKLAVCEGECDRKLRPLACRIFPLAPYLSKDGRLSIIEDPRARYICPLLFPGLGIKVRKMFMRKVYKVFSLLINDQKIREYIVHLSKTLNDYSKFTGTGMSGFIVYDEQ